MAKGHRYLVISELFLPTKGGTAVWFDEVYKRIGDKDIHIVTADVPGAAQYDATHPNHIHRLSLRRHWWLKPESAAMYIKLFATAYLLTLKHSFDAVHAGRVLPEGLVGWLISILVRRPLIIYAHGEEITTWRQSAKFKAMTFVYKRAQRIIANSEFTRDELIKLGIAADKITLIYPGVDLSRFRPGLASADLRVSIGVSDNQKLIISVGRLSRRKGFDQVIRALPILLKQGIDVHYVLIGIGEDHAYLNALAAEMGVAERLHMPGHVSPEDLPRWYNAADVFAMPNREINGDTEGFGMVFLEAAACAKSAIAGDAGGTGAAVVHGMTGLRVNGGVAEEVSAALVRVLTDIEFAKQLGANALERARAEFGWDIVADKTKRLALNPTDKL